MKVWDWLLGLIADVFASLGVVAIVVVIAFGVALVAGWIDLGALLDWLQSLMP